MFPTLQKYYPIIPELENTENRKMAVNPVLHLDFLDPFPQEFEKYYNDNFSLRNQLVRLRSSFIINTLHQSPMPDKVIFGKGDWLFLVKNELSEYRGTNLFSKDTIDIITKELLKRKDYLKTKNSKLYIVVAPTKYSVYPEYVPDYVDVINKTSRTDQIITALQKSGINTLDLRPELINAKKHGIIYYKTDNHWNNMGAFYAYKAIIKRLKEDFNTVPLLSIDDFEIEKKDIKGKNNAKLLGIADNIADISYDFIQKEPSKARVVAKVGYPIPKFFAYKWAYEMDYETGTDSLPDILFIRDSFGDAIIPFMNQSFDRSVFIFDKWSYKSNKHIVDNENPDIVVYMILESFWANFLDGIE